MSESELSRRRRRRRRGSSPAALTSLPDDDDMLREILLRLPPQPSSLPRASAVCKRWGGLVTDPKFISRFRAHHRKPPLLGVFEHRDQNIVFTPVLDPPDRIHPRRFDLRIRCRSFLGAQLLGCRHGRVLVVDEGRKYVFVCDPITGEQQRMPFPPGFKIFSLNGAVVCAAGDQGHMHGDCHSNPFKAVLVSMANNRPVACVYSSKTGMWGDLISAEVPSPACCGGSASTLVGNVLYWPFKFAIDYILEFDLERQTLDLTRGPLGMDESQLHQIIRVEDGVVGLAIFSCYTIQMWQRKVNSLGVTTWLLWKMVQRRDILGFPPKIMRKRNWLGKILGYDEDTHTIYLYVVGGVYMLQLNSLHMKQLYETSYSNAKQCHPFTSFYTPGKTIAGGGAEMLHKG